MGVIDQLRNWWKSPRSRSAGTDRTLERIIDLTDPRLRVAKLYRERLRPAVKSAMEYAAEVVADAAPAREATADAWLSDSSLRAFFATPDDVARELSLSAPVREWFDRNSLA